jgi:hypothetical protein
MAKALSEAGLDFEIAEATDHVGGNWAHGVYETAHIISSKHTTEYPDWPMPAEYPDFPSAQQMCAYYNDYADAHGLREKIRFDSPVRSVRQRDDELWDVTFEAERSVVYRGVVVCNGHHWDRDFPDWTGAFSGELLHSKDYKRPDQLRGKRVLVVGGGNSGCDVASEAARVSEYCAWSLRRGYWFMPKTVFGVPAVELTRPGIPLFVQRAAVKAMLRIVVGPYSKYGLPQPDHEIFDAHPTVSTEVFHYLKHGRLTPRGDVRSVDGMTVTFADGTVEPFDTIVCATGYKVSFPFLDEGVVPVVGKVAALYGGMLRPDARHLYVMGTSQVRYGIGPLLRPLAELLAEWVALQDELEMPLGAVLKRAGQTLPTTHLLEPHAAMADLRRARRLTPALRKVAKGIARLSTRRRARR